MQQHDTGGGCKPHGAVHPSYMCILVAVICRTSYIELKFVILVRLLNDLIRLRKMLLKFCQNVPGILSKFHQIQSLSKLLCYSMWII